MRMVFVVAALVVSTRSLHARPLWEEPDAPVYPDELVDRPLLLLPGMTAIDAAYAVHSHDQVRFVDDMPDLHVAHAFGPVEIDAQIAGTAVVQIAVPFGRFPDAIVFGASTTPQAPDKTMAIAQYIEAEHKLHVVPQGLAFVVGVGAGYNEDHIRVPGLQWVRSVDAAAIAQIQIQLASIVALYSDASINLPIAASNGVKFETSFDVRAGVSLTLAHSCDLFVTAAVAADQASTSYSLGGGVEKRFGP
jgi:hypothetical protein